MLRTGGGPEELLAVKYLIVPYTRGKGLDIGRGPWKAFPHFIGVRERSDDTLVDVAPDFACDTFEEGLAAFEDGSMDFIFDWCLYGTRESVSAERLLKEGGYYLTALSDGALLIDRKTKGKLVLIDAHGEKRCQGAKTVCVVRYGAIGDAMQSAALLPELKRQGYHVTVMCHPDTQNVLKHDPHIDAFWIQDKDQVPNQELVPYWKAVSKRFDRFINLCETVEGTLLTLPGRANHQWPDAVRRKYCNVNYLEFAAEVAELPFHPEHHFYSTPEEDAEAQKTIDEIRTAVNAEREKFERSVDQFVVMWALAGSSVHKFYPHQDAVVARIMLEVPNAHVIFVGDPACKILEAGWEEEPRIRCLSGMLEIRQTLALAKKCQLIVGPETGVLNAMAFESMAKIVFLSHSTAENLTKHWVNTEALHSTVTPCYPCHRLHYTREFCPEHKETGSAMCQHDLPPADVWLAVQRAFIGWGTVRNLLRAA